MAESMINCRLSVRFMICFQLFTKTNPTDRWSELFSIFNAVNLECQVKKFFGIKNKKGASLIPVPPNFFFGFFRTLPRNFLPIYRRSSNTAFTLSRVTRVYGIEYMAFLCPNWR